MSKGFRLILMPKGRLALSKGDGAELAIAKSSC